MDGSVDGLVVDQSLDSGSWWGGLWHRGEAVS